MVASASARGGGGGAEACHFVTALVLLVTCAFHKLASVNWPQLEVPKWDRKLLPEPVVKDQAAGPASGSSVT